MTDTSPAAVERFTPYGFNEEMAIRADGDYVRYSDYAALSAQLTAANQRHAAALGAVATARAEGRAEGLRDAAKRYREGDDWDVFATADCAILDLIPADTPAAETTNQRAPDGTPNNAI